MPLATLCYRTTNVSLSTVTAGRGRRRKAEQATLWPLHKTTGVESAEPGAGTTESMVEASHDSLGLKLAAVSGTSNCKPRTGY